MKRPQWLKTRRQRENEAFNQFARAVLETANRGVDVSFLWSCPDLTRLAVKREKS